MILTSEVSDETLENAGAHVGRIGEITLNFSLGNWAAQLAMAGATLFN
jgi:hypothetical protein